MEHFHGFGVWVVMREGVIELIVRGHDLNADAFQNLWAKGRSGAVAGGTHHLELAGHFEITAEVIEIGFKHTLYALIFAAITRQSTISRSSLISSGPWVSGRSKPIFTPVQPFGLCEAVTIATAGASRWN